MFLAVTLVTSYASATVINGDLSDTGGGANDGLYVGQGAYSDPGNNYWNNLQVTSGGTSSATWSAVKDSTGTATAVNVAANSVIGGDGGGGEVPFALLGDFIASPSSTATSTLVISGLPASTSGYQLYLYGVADYPPTYIGCKFTVNSSVQSTTGTSNNGFQLGINYVVYSNVTTDGSGNITVTFQSGNGVNDGYFNGFQLVSPSGTIPEPGTLALLATGLAGLLCYAWRKRR